MSDAVDEVRDLLQQCADLPYGPSQIAKVEEAIRQADVDGDPRLRFDARMLATDAYTFGGEPAKAFVTFSWCLAEFDRSPELFNQWDDEQLRWHYKWIVSALRDFPEVPLHRTTELLDDMERRYRLGGHSLHAVYALRWRLARHVGDESAADEWFDRWCAAPRDENSDCEGCDPTSKVEHLVDRGRDTEALALAEPVLEGHLTCHQQPHSMLTELLVPYLRTGQHEKAREAHLRGYRGFRDRIADLFEIAQHVEFCALTGNEARGLELIERHLDWLDRAPSPRAAMRFATAAALVLRRLVKAGRGDLTVYRRASAGRPAGPVSSTELAEELTALAHRHAERFDARNGTAHCSTEVLRLLDAEPLVEYLPLSAVARATRQVAADRGTAVAGSAAARAARLAARTADIRAELPEDIGPDELLDLAEHAYRVLDDDSRAVILWSLFADRFATAPLTGHQLARAMDARARAGAISQHDLTGAELAFREAVTLYREAGDEAAAWVAQTWLGGVLSQLGEVSSGIPLLTEAIAALAEAGHRDLLCRCELRLAEALAFAGRFDEALAAVDRAADAEPHDPAPTSGLRLGLARACCSLWTGRFTSAADLARLVRAESEQAGRPDIAGLASACLGYALDNAGEDRAAIEAYGEALRTCQDAQLLGQVRAARAHALANSARADEAIDDLVEVVAQLVAAGSDSEAAVAQFDLAVAYHACGNLIDAAETAETAVRALEQAGEQAAADRCRYRLSKIYVDLDEPESALAILDELIARLDGYDNLQTRGQIHEDAGRILFAGDRDAAAAARFTAADECFRACDQHHDAARVRRARAVALSWAEEDPELGVQALHEADLLIDQLPADDPGTAYERAMLDADGARVFANVGRASDAVDRLETVPRRLRAIDAYGEALEAELLRARLLLGVGRLDDGEELLRSVIAGSPVDSAVHRSAAWTLIAVLEETGRTEDATELRAQYGVTGTVNEENDD